MIERDEFLKVLSGDQTALASAFSATRRAREHCFGKGIQMKDLQVVGQVGVSAMSAVRVVKSTLEDANYYALKAIAKWKVVEGSQQSHVRNERKILSLCGDHPNVVKFVASFRDAYCVYVLLEFVPGGELFSLIHGRRRGGPRLSLFEDEVRFYSGCAGLALEYLHSLGVAYRDLKPEHLVLDQRGFLKLVDFGLATMEKKKSTKHPTFCGTTEYLAPEMIAGTGHTKAVDLWALGVLIFELISGRTPFNVPDHLEDSVSSNRRHHTDTQSNETCDRIIHRRFQYSRDFDRFDDSAAALVDRLLSLDPTSRLPAADLRHHPWYSSLDFDALFHQSIDAPWKPRLAGPGDTSNFDRGRSHEDPTLLRVHPRGTDDWDADF